GPAVRPVGRANRAGGRLTSGSARLSRRAADVKRRWDIDEIGHGIASGRAFTPDVQRLEAALELPDWIAEEPEAQLLPDLRRSVEGGAALQVRLESPRATEPVSSGARRVPSGWSAGRGEGLAANRAMCASPGRHRR